MRSEGKLGKDAVFSIRSTDVKSVTYNNDFKVRPGEKINIKVNTNLAVRMNPAQPTSAVVFVKFEASDEESGLSFQMETVTAVSSSTYVDDFEEVIKSDYINTIMLAVNEKIPSPFVSERNSVLYPKSPRVGIMNSRCILSPFGVISVSSPLR